MLVESFQAQMFGTNCWVIAPGVNSECVIIDPGMPLVSDEVSSILAQNNLKPVAVLATHGHLDHTFSIKPLCDGYNIPTLIHPEDRQLLLHPERAVRPEFAQTFGDLIFAEAQDVREIKNGEKLDLLDLDFEVIHAPGHTRGSIMFKINEEVLVTGDVLFAGTIGRTDLPTGSAEAMEQSLRNKVWPLEDSLRVLPGHGRETTIGEERKYNPYLNSISGTR